MKKLIILFFVLLIPVYLITCYISGCKTSDQYYARLKASDDPKDNYQRFCSGCHGAGLDMFIRQKKDYSTQKAYMKDIIQSGKKITGMPSFLATFNEKQVDDLAEFIVANSKAVNKPEAGFGKVIESQKQKFSIDTVLQNLDVPWGMKFLPNGDLLVTERNGYLLRYSADKKLDTIKGTPKVYANGQGGLLDIELHPDYQTNGWIYISYSYPSPNNIEEGGNTAVMRAHLNGNELVDQEIIFKAIPLTKSGVHFGSRLEFDRENYLYISVGERGNWNNAQDLTNHCGKVHRVFDDGKVPPGNPFVNVKDAIPTIFSYGHRNVQGICINPLNNDIWTHEHGPKGGDEINIIRKGKNYGWPLISYGINYDGTIITEDTVKEGLEQPLLFWRPSIGPCGMAFVNGNKYKGWEGDLFVGSLSFKYLHRCDIEGNKVIAQEKLLQNIGRVRNVELSPDGYIYFSVEKPGMVFKLVPVE